MLERQSFLKYEPAYPHKYYYSNIVGPILIMIYARSIACSSAEGFRSKTRTRTFDKLVITSKKLFLPNVAAKVAITPKNCEKSCFCFLMVIFGDLCQNMKKHKNFGQIFPFPELPISPKLSETSKNVIVAKAQRSK